MEESKMSIETLTVFFMWCTIMNFAVLAIWTIVFAYARDFVFRIQSKFFPITEESFNVVVYSSLTIYRVIFVVFALVPYLALLTIR